ncbi:hypothetical protein ZIOFF_051284 [Zingiber officinale]|uniref:Transposase-associated domain-containing protein n=1 Tax=Zingiber officinale TaxID=94328 RepID=A0A8J5FIG3_ZINOF|nr:hypothetical protein ZIOFF_051284 [Zingiber officinale]
MILCPCIRCKIGIFVSREVAFDHLMVDGFIKGYTHWVAHGEISYNTSINSTSVPSRKYADDMQGLVYEAFGISDNDNIISTSEFENDNEISTGETKKFYKLIDDSQKELYPGCKKFSKLAFMIRLLHLKCLGKINNKIFDMLLDLLREAFPNAMDDLPKSYYEAEKLMKQIGLGYENIDVCPNYCTLYWRLDKERIQCETCTSHMRWYSESRTNDGYMRHPADSSTWQTFDHKLSEFTKDPRNIRLGLASDGFNPFKNIRNNIDIYLQPLIANLKDLWEIGVQTYDASNKQNFQLHVASL